MITFMTAVALWYVATGAVITLITVKAAWDNSPANLRGVDVSGDSLAALSKGALTWPSLVYSMVAELTASDWRDS